MKIHGNRLPDADYADRFKARRMEKTTVDPVTDCWLWQGLVNDKGYGVSNYRCTRMFLHRAAYRTFKGPIPEGKQVRHLCARKLCWNPEHLVPGTQSDNEQDKKLVGRASLGEHRYNAKLTEDDVRAIRELEGKKSHGQIAKQYGVARPSIGRIIRREIWGHVQ
jgi:hypothetical protein